MIAVSITQAELDRHDACRESRGRELLSTISVQQWGVDTGEVVVSRWTPLHSVWLAWAYPGHAAWLRDEGIVPGANLDGASLRGANLRGANRSRLDPAIDGWTVVDGRLGTA